MAVTLFLALPTGPALAQQCNASHIEVSQVFPATPRPAIEGTNGGLIIWFTPKNCGSSQTPRDYPIPFCVEIFDTTPCGAKPNNCLANNVAGASGLQGDRWEDAGAFKRCTTMTEREEGGISALITPHENSVRDTGENAIYVIMRNPTRYLRIPIRDND